MSRPAQRRISFTVRKIKSLKPLTTRVDYWDNSLPRFGIRVTASGQKTWVVLYRYHRRARRMTLGRYPDFSAREI
jgi:Arm DNA-binding domain